ncbi:hypothetical protein BEWA_032850 [Theileria equi strain WA]|uniref:Protein kinase domain-containing protein n=1 Tax=Theileria equi strain WA TaxID=1537102 RepID=L0AXY6_THEEQ|nr:hypothetical protein BEWA_032850 [Theileria equi strain WA]AFZ80432.1 hypothetical protein BEWA_032850 [Theileria equi strain WA]|eukprot:XP_004830098.1 hypothetical protein BEWA_032850 [Theileria equi strain WA]
MSGEEGNEATGVQYNGRHKSARELSFLKEEDLVKNVDFDSFLDQSMASDDNSNSILNYFNKCDNIDSPVRLETSENGLAGFASLKTKTFDNNFRDLHDLKRENELLTLSKRYLYSKLYTPKLEALQKLVEPGAYPGSRVPFGRDVNRNTHIHSSSTSKAQRKVLGRTTTHFTLDPNFMDTSTDTRTEDLEVSSDFVGDSTSMFKGNVASFEDSTLAPDLSESDTDRMSTKRPSVEFDAFSTLPEKRIHTSKISQAQKNTQNVITLMSNHVNVNGVKKKRVQIPQSAYKRAHTGGDESSNKIVLKLVDSEESPKSLAEKIECCLDNIVDSIELYGTEIVNPEIILESLEAIRPQSMDKEVFDLLCLKPIGMSGEEFSNLMSNYGGEEFINQLQNFNAVNTNAMGQVLDPEHEILKELNRLGRIHKKLINEHTYYTNVFARLKENFASQVEDLLQTTRQDLRLEGGYSYLQWGRIKNITSWKQGDPIIREKGFAQDMASKNKIKTLQRMEEAFGSNIKTCVDSPISHIPMEEGQYIYFIKSLQDVEEKEQEAFQLQVRRDRLQTIAEFTVAGPPYKPEDCLAWKCIGLSCNSIVWKMYNTAECRPIVYKFRALKESDSRTIETLKKMYNTAFEKIKGLKFKLSKRRQILFSSSVNIKGNMIIEEMPFVNYTPFFLFMEKSMQLNSNEKFAHTQVVVREIVRLVNQIKDLNFILPLKSSRVFVSSGKIVLSAGVPLSILGKEYIDLAGKIAQPTIASLLWGKHINWYLPPEANNNPAYTTDPTLISKAHTWMIGKIIYEATSPTTITRQELDISRIDTCENDVTREFLKICLNVNVDARPTIEELLSFPYMRRIKINYGTLVPTNVPKSRCAVEFMGDLETILLNKIRRTEKGVADYEQQEEVDIKFCDSDDDNLGSLNDIDKYAYYLNIANEIS